MEITCSLVDINLMNIKLITKSIHLSKQNSNTEYRHVRTFKWQKKKYTTLILLWSFGEYKIIEIILTFKYAKLYKKNLFIAYKIVAIV